MPMISYPKVSAITWESFRSVEKREAEKQEDINTAGHSTGAYSTCSIPTDHMCTTLPECHVGSAS